MASIVYLKIAVDFVNLNNSTSMQLGRPDFRCHHDSLVIDHSQILQNYVNSEFRLA